MSLSIVGCLIPVPLKAAVNSCLVAVLILVGFFVSVPFPLESGRVQLGILV